MNVSERFLNEITPPSITTPRDSTTAPKTVDTISITMKQIGLQVKNAVKTCNSNPDHKEKAMCRVNSYRSAIVKLNGLIYRCGSTKSADTCRNKINNVVLKFKAKIEKENNSLKAMNKKQFDKK